MINEVYSLDEAFTKVVEAVLSNESCGNTLIRKYEGISADSIAINCDECQEIDSDTFEDEILFLENCPKYQTIIAYAPFGPRQTPGVRSELEYIERLLGVLKKNGRLIVTVPSNFMTAPYAKETRKQILLFYRLKMVIQLPTRLAGPNGIYALEIENSTPESSVRYFVKSKYNHAEDMLSALRAGEASYEVPYEMLDQRWDAQYHDPMYNTIRKKYLSKNTVRLGDLASVIPGTRIKSEDRKEEGEYLILSPREIAGDSINYSDERSFYTHLNLEDRSFSRAVLLEGDIVVCISGKIRFLVFHDNKKKVVAGPSLCIIRAASAENQRYLQLYFGSQLGEENFNLQAQMLSVGDFFTHLSPITLSSFVIPNISTLEMAANMQKSKNLINKVAMLFESEGWEVLRNYRPMNSNGLEFDLALKTTEQIVGIVETKRNTALNTERKQQIKEQAEKALRSENVRFFILFINDAMYRYKDNEFFRIPEIPTPDNYTLFDKSDDLFVNSADDEDIKEVPQGTAPIADQYLILSAISDLKHVLGNKIDAVQRSLDTISAQIQELSGRISIYQDLVGKQLEYAKDDLEEQERILKVFTDTCVERVTEKIRSEYAHELYNDERQNLIDSLGLSAWNKLDSDSQNFLVSSKVMYQKLQGISEIVDYSGVCLLVTKALELELGKRFCQNYITYYKEAYPGKEGRDSAPLPILNKYHRYIKPHDFTLGSFPFVVGSQFIDDIDDLAKENIKTKIVEYVRQGVLKTFSLTHNDEEILELLSGYADDVDRVRKDYRNPSAHTNALTKVSAKECFDLVLDVEKLLKKIMDSFDE